MVHLIEAMRSLPPELLSLILIAVSYSGVLIFMRYFGLSGVAAFFVLAVIGANIQVLKVVKFSVFDHPVALGTELFASSYLAIDIVTENYGKEQARKIIWIGFACQILFTALMLITLGYASPLVGSAEDLARIGAVESALNTILQPQAGLLAAGLFSYLLSQHLDVSIFVWLRRETGGRFLWLRNGASNIVAALVDTIVFSFLAWRVFAPEPVPLDALLYTYILGTFCIRVFVSLLDTPFMYLSRRVFRGERGAAEAGQASHG